MALFRSRASRPSAVRASSYPSDSLAPFSGMPVQVFNGEGAYLFTAAFRLLARDSAQLRWISGIQPQDIGRYCESRFQGSLRGYNKVLHRAFRASGTLIRETETTWTMTRAFKRYTGMTPSAWREQAIQL